MIERIAILLLLALAGAALLIAARVYLARLRSQASLATSVVAAGNSPALIYLYTSECSVCPQQARVVDALSARYDGALRVLKVDALADRETSDRYGVWTVPATVVTDAGGRTVAVNCGLTSASRLDRQIASALASGGPSPKEPAGVA